MQRVLVANRGEVAVRIIRACHSLGIEAVLAHSEADRGSWSTRLADRSVCVGGSRSADSYLSIDRLTGAAVATGCDAVHPGYGFLAESAQFAEAVEAAGLTFVGPRPSALRTMGDKEAARDAAARAGLPVLRATPAVSTFAELDVSTLDFPLLLKAVAGGGGRGIRIVDSSDVLEQSLALAAAEADAAFGDGRVYCETFIRRARHIEVQVLADSHGHVVHLGDRECTVQRRHQKMLEEAPSGIDADERDRLCAWAVNLCKSLGYRGAGTIEFIYDMDLKRSWFIEMNARLQVEHGVTEMVTGVDIVATQLRIADGGPLPFEQQDIAVLGHAVEWRLTCEAVERGFVPVPGELTIWELPILPHVRVDTHCIQGYRVPPFYDSLLAKLMAWAPERDDAIDRLRTALTSLTIAGVPTTRGLADVVLRHDAFRSATVHTRWLDQVVKSLVEV